MVVRFRILGFLACVVALSGCGKFDFFTAKAVREVATDPEVSNVKKDPVAVVKVPTVTRVTLAAPQSMKQRQCSGPIQIQSFDASGNLLAPPPTAVMRLEGFSAGDLFYANATCTGTALDPAALKFATAASSMSLYVKPDLSGARALVVRSDYPEAAASAMVTREVTSLGFATGPATAPAGKCVGPYAFQVRDARGDLFDQTSFRYSVALTGTASGGTTATFSDSACTIALGTAPVVTAASEGSFYVRSGKIGTLSLQVTSPDAVGISSPARSTGYEAAVVAIRVTGGPASLVLGVANTVPFKVETLDINGAPLAPRASDLAAGQTEFPIKVTFIQGTGSAYNVCNPISGLTELFPIAVAGLYKEFCLKAMTRTQVMIRAESPGNAFIAPVTRTLSVVEAAASIALQAPLEQFAGMPSDAFRIQVLDGLNAPIAPNPAMSIQLIAPAGARAVFCSTPKCADGSILANNTIVTNGTPDLAFYMVSDSDSTSTYTIEARPATVGVGGASRATQVKRIPLSLDDPNFGTNGFSSIAYPQMDRGEISAGLASNGKLVGTGYWRIGELNTFGLVRLRGVTGANNEMPGTLDTTFNTTGRVLKAIGQQSFGTAIASQFQVVTVNGQVQTLEKYLVAVASFSAATNWDVAIARFNLDGTIDNSFGSYGVAVLALAGNQFPFSLAVAASGVIYVAGETDTGTAGDLNFLVSAFTADGKPGTVANGAAVTFGTNGTLTFDFSNYQDSASALVVSGTGTAERVLIGGTSHGDFAFVRLLRTGALDTTFGTNGRIVHDLGGEETLRAVVIPASGNPVAAGYSKQGALTNVALVRLRNVAGAAAGQVPGTLDPTFGTMTGKTLANVVDGYDEEIYSLAIDPREGLLFVAGRAFNAQVSESFVARFTRDGVLDNGLTPWFKILDMGGLDDRANAVVLLTSGKPVLFGQGEVENRSQMKAACLLR